MLKETPTPPRSLLRTPTLSTVRSWIVDGNKNYEDLDPVATVKALFSIASHKPNENPSPMDITQGIMAAVTDRMTLANSLRDKYATGTLWEFDTGFGPTVVFSKVPRANSGINMLVISLRYDKQTEDGSVVKATRQLCRYTGAECEFLAHEVAIEDPSDAGPSKYFFTFRFGDREITDMGVSSRILECKNDLDDVMLGIEEFKNLHGLSSIKTDKAKYLAYLTEVLRNNKDFQACLEKHSLSLHTVSYSRTEGYLVDLCVHVKPVMEEVPGEVVIEPSEPEPEQPVKEENNVSTSDTQAVEPTPSEDGSDGGPTGGEAPSDENVAREGEARPDEPTEGSVSDEQVRAEPLPDDLISVEDYDLLRIRTSNRVWTVGHELLEAGKVFSLEQFGDLLHEQFSDYDFNVVFNTQKHQYNIYVKEKGKAVKKAAPAEIPPAPVKEPAPVEEAPAQEPAPAEPVAEEPQEETQSYFQPDQPEEQEMTPEEPEVPQDQPSAKVETRQEKIMRLVGMCKEHIKEHAEEWAKMDSQSKTAFIASFLTGHSVSKEDVELILGSKQNQQQKQEQPAPEPEQVTEHKEEKEVKVRINAHEAIPNSMYELIKSTVQANIELAPDYQAIASKVTEALGGKEVFVEYSMELGGDIIVTIPDTVTAPVDPDLAKPKKVEQPPLDPGQTQEPDAGEKLPEPPAEIPAEDAAPALDLSDPDIRQRIMQGALFPGIGQPSYQHLMNFLKDYLTEIKWKSYLETDGTIPTEVFIGYDNEVISIVKFKEGRYWKIFVAQNDVGLADQSWLETHGIIGRWFQLCQTINAPTANGGQPFNRNGYRHPRRY